MPRVSGFYDIDMPTVRTSRRKTFPRADWAFLLHVGMNCAAAFHTVHDAGHVIGDVNAKNIFVSTQGTVRLIDCDSFQVQAGGRPFLSGMHVPEFTPPELQHRDLKHVSRTPNHDAFGLAVVIFHLLFLGRHPFFGVPLPDGAAPIPIETALAQFRFAFGRDAPTRGMRPPPHTLPLECLPGDVAQLFGRAFLQGSATGARPSASEWRDALRRLSGQLATCSAESTHRYPRQLGECPWCWFVRSGVPDFFPDASGAIAFSCPQSEVAPLWAAIASVTFLASPGATWNQPRGCASTPLPADAVADRSRIHQVRFWTWAIGSLSTVLLLLLGILASPWLLLPAIIVLVATAGTAGNAFGLVQRSAFTAEVTRRRELAREATGRVWALEQQLHQRRSEYEAAYMTLPGRLQPAYHELTTLPQRYDQEYAQLAKAKREAQHRDFLRGHLIADARIEKIGPGRKRTLVSYGIETAYDVVHGPLHSIPGFGPGLRATLRGWADTLSARFRFDPAKDVAESDRRQLVLKFRQRKTLLRGTLETGAQQLRALNERYSRDAADLLRQLDGASWAREQTMADCAVLARRN